ncbi:hypothetical protein CAPTEDRAFT_220555 [Capitella teleta]|uniref:Uncharacterized protein n=1 Tax=Capitella teleta TaxID=283909 RepID=R7T643_CAPTE|nr:hypothetical protein CAPTEDRAFT_220555 [Capitella teleta]|eukprot:ELT88845.1 hypothetical protein CAPTEDRAFT_220555 [Capitella teleta]
MEPKKRRNTEAVERIASMGEFRVHRCRFFDYQPESIQCLAYSPEFKRLALSRSDASLEIWNVESNWFQEKVFPPQKGCSIEALLWSGSRLFSAGLHCELIEHDLLTGQIKCSAHSNCGPIWCMAMNNAQTQIAAGTEEGCVVLFDVLEMHVINSRLLDKAEGRILSIAWYEPENLIVTGGIDCIRVWSLKSGHAIQRLTLPRKERAKETIVWAIAITEYIISSMDFTIVSGDSSGKTCFWNGKQGTLMKAFESHRAAVLTLALTEGGTKAYSAGIDPAIAHFDLIAPHHKSNARMWVMTSKRVEHTHDVRALQIVNQELVSGGVDCALIVSSLKKKKLTKKNLEKVKKIASVPHRSLVHLAPGIDSVVLQYPTSIDIWRLGSTKSQSDKDSEILTLWSKSAKLLELNARDEEVIVCCTVSQCGRFIAYCDTTNLRIFSMTLVSVELPSDALDDPVSKQDDAPSPSVQVTRLRGLPSTILLACAMCFADNLLVTLTTCGRIQVISMTEGHVSVKHTVTVRDTGADPANMGLHLLNVCPKNNHIAFADHSGNVHLMDLLTTEVSSLPRRSSLATALAFHPENKVLLAVYADMKIFEYDYERSEYTEWSRKQNAFYHPWWLRNSVITQASYISRDKMMLRHEGFLFIIDTKQSRAGYVSALYYLHKHMYQFTHCHW